ncbi:hypothetical protein D9M71_606010 [compost metagenome]
MEQAGVGEDAVEALGGQVEGEEILMPDFATGVGAGHGDEVLGAVQANGLVAQAGERPQVAPRATAEVEDAEGSIATDVPQQGLDVLADVVVAGAFAEAFGSAVVVVQGGGSDAGEVFGAQGHLRLGYRSEGDGRF